VEYSINRSFDERYGYRTKSMLVIPMKDHKEEMIGVLQLINRKRHPDAVLATPADVEHQVVPYSRRTVELVTALAGQAAVAIENSRLYEEIERLFEGFVKAAVHAIEQRDPTTFGHSGRVANMTVGLAAVVARAEDGAYRGVTFTREQIKEIRYAGLLHDFGKVGVREQVLIKAKKLYPLQLDLIRQRHHFVRRTAEREFWRKRAEFLEAHDRKDYEPFLRALEEEHAREIAVLDGFLDAVLSANEPTVLPAGPSKRCSSCRVARTKIPRAARSPISPRRRCAFSPSPRAHSTRRSAWKSRATSPTRTGSCSRSPGRESSRTSP